MEKEIAKIIKILNKHKIKYLVIGGVAVVLYGVPRSTFDIDIGIALDNNEINKTISLLHKYGFYEKEPLGQGIRLTNNKIDLDLMYIEPYKFNFYYQYHKKHQYSDTIVKLPSMLDLIRMKETSDRPKDQEDARYLRIILSIGRK